MCKVFDEFGNLRSVVHELSEAIRPLYRCVYRKCDYYQEFRRENASTVLKGPRRIGNQFRYSNLCARSRRGRVCRLPTACADRKEYRQASRRSYQVKARRPRLRPQDLRSKEAICDQDAEGHRRSVNLPTEASPPCLRRRSLQGRALRESHEGAQCSGREHKVPCHPNSRGIAYRSRELRASINVLVLCRLVQPFHPCATI